jgi:hypothetical protein
LLKDGKRPKNKVSNSAQEHRVVSLNPPLIPRLDLAKALREKLLAGSTKTAERRGNSGSFAYRPQDIWHKKRLRGEPVFQCHAISKRSGKRCRFSAIKGGSGVCYWHGGTGGDNRKPTMPTSRRHLANKEIKRARTYAEAEAERLITAGGLHPETRGMLKSMNLKSLHPADYGRLTWAASEFLHGNMTRDAWREAQRAVGLLRPRPPESPAPAPSMPEPEPELRSVEWWGSPRNAKPSGF